MDKIWENRRRFSHRTIPSARKAHAYVVSVARCSVLRANAALVLGFVQFFAINGTDNKHQLIDMP